MRISVIIATYNRARLLEGCLRQFEQQQFLPGDEVVVANNGSTDATPRVVEEASARLPGLVRLMTETRPGKSSAVATAVAGATGDVLAFTDDDVQVAADWVASIRRAMASGELALVGGPVLPMYSRRVPDWLDLEGDAGFGRMAAPLGLLHYGPKPAALGARVVLGANIAVRRDAFLRVGGYPSHLGKLRGTLQSGEDHELCERIQEAGYRAAYDPSIRVRHVVPADRLRPAYFLRWFFWSGMTHATRDRERPPHPGGRQVLGAPGYVVRDLATASARSAASALCTSWSALAEHSTRAAFAAGYLWTTWMARGPVRVASPGRPAEAA